MCLCRSVRATSPVSYCDHVSTVKRETQLTEPLPLDPAALCNLPIPPEAKAELEGLYSNSRNLIARVSQETFVVRQQCQSSLNPLDLIHVRVRMKDTRAHRSPVFMCPCQEFKRFSSHFHGAPTTTKPSRRCIHFYLCLWAFASTNGLAEEFSFVNGLCCYPQIAWWFDCHALHNNHAGEQHPSSPPKHDSTEQGSVLLYTIHLCYTCYR